MPVYDYKCKECDAIFSKLMSMKRYSTSKKLQRCPACGKIRASRLIRTSPSIKFVGSGFYVNDSKERK